MSTRPARLSQASSCTPRTSAGSSITWTSSTSSRVLRAAPSWHRAGHANNDMPLPSALDRGGGLDKPPPRLEHRGAMRLARVRSSRGCSAVVRQGDRERARERARLIDALARGSDDVARATAGLMPTQSSRETRNQPCEENRGVQAASVVSARTPTATRRTSLRRTSYARSTRQALERARARTQRITDNDGAQA
jgi:hypothetical protein